MVEKHIFFFKKDFILNNIHFTKILRNFSKKTIILVDLKPVILITFKLINYDLHIKLNIIGLFIKMSAKY